MKLFQTTARFLVAATLLLSLGACDRDDDLFVRKEYSRVDVPLTGAQNFPPSPSSALGTMDIHYNTTTKLLSYTIRWSGLSGPVATSPIPGMSIHGMAPAGFPANPIQLFTLSGITRCATFTNTSCGSYSGRFICRWCFDYRREFAERSLLCKYSYSRIPTWRAESTN